MKSQFTLKSKLKSSILMFGLLLSPFVNAQTPVWEEEAEEAFEVMYTEVATVPAFSGGKGLMEMSASRKSVALYYVEVDKEGVYDLVIYYSSMQERYLTIGINNQVPTVVLFDELTGSWDGNPGEVDGEMKEGIASKTIQVYLEAGENVMTVSAYEGYSASLQKTNHAAPNLDRFEIYESSADFAKPANQITPIIIEAENASFSGSAGISNEPRTIFSGQSGAGSGGDGEIIFNDIQVQEEGAYALKIYYATMNVRWMSLKVNDYVKEYLEFDQLTNSWGDTESDNPMRPSVYQKVAQIYLKQGYNTIILGSHFGETSAHQDSPNIDYIEIIKVNADMDEPNVQIMSLPFDFTDLATLTCADSENLELLNDNNEYTTFKIAGVKNTEIIAETEYPIMLTGYAWATTSNATKWEMDYSVDGQNWKKVETTTTSNTNNFSVHTTTNNFDEPNAAKYYRLKISGDQDVEIGEWQLYGMPYLEEYAHFPEDLMNQDVMLIASDPGFNPGGEFNEVYQNVIDQRGDTKYTITEARSLWLQYEFDEPTEVLSYSITVPYTTEYMKRNPKNWQLTAFDEETGDWIELHRVEELIFHTPATTVMFNIPESVAGAYYAYKLEVSQNNGSEDIHLAQWQMFAEAQDLPEPTSVAQEDEYSFAVYTLKGKVVISSELAKSSNYTIYNITGQVVAKGLVESGVNEISLPAGLYVVVVDNKAIKVLVN